MRLTHVSTYVAIAGAHISSAACAPGAPKGPPPGQAPAPVPTDLPVTG